MKSLLSVVMFTILLAGCGQHGREERVQADAGIAAREDSVRIVLFEDNGGWGYDIFIGDKQFIHQPIIPVSGGRLPFLTEADAYKTASLVVQKIKSDIFPPSVSLRELDSMGVTNPTKL